MVSKAFEGGFDSNERIPASVPIEAIVSSRWTVKEGPFLLYFLSPDSRDSRPTSHMSPVRPFNSCVILNLWSQSFIFFYTHFFFLTCATTHFLAAMFLSTWCEKTCCSSSQVWRKEQEHVDTRDEEAKKCDWEKKRSDGWSLDAWDVGRSQMMDHIAVIASLKCVMLDTHHFYPILPLFPTFFSISCSGKQAVIYSSDDPFFEEEKSHSDEPVENSRPRRQMIANISRQLLPTSSQQLVIYSHAITFIAVVFSRTDDATAVHRFKKEADLLKEPVNTQQITSTRMMCVLRDAGVKIPTLNRLDVKGMPLTSWWRVVTECLTPLFLSLRLLFHASFSHPFLSSSCDPAVSRKLLWLLFRLLPIYTRRFGSLLVFKLRRVSDDRVWEQVSTEAGILCHF